MGVLCVKEIHLPALEAAWLKSGCMWWSPFHVQCVKKYSNPYLLDLRKTMFSSCPHFLNIIVIMENKNKELTPVLHTKKNIRFYAFSLERLPDNGTFQNILMRCVVFSVKTAFFRLQLGHKPAFIKWRTGPITGKELSPTFLVQLSLSKQVYIFFKNCMNFTK